MVNWKETGGTITVDRNTVVIPPRTTNQVWAGTGPSIPQISICSHKIRGTRRSIITQEVINAKTLDASINKIPAKHRDPTPDEVRLSVVKQSSTKVTTSTHAVG